MNNLSSYESNYRNLTFTKLFTYCAGRGITLKEDTFENELDFKTEKGKYNLLAQLFSDNYDISVKINFYSTETKGDSLFKVKEIKESCLILMLDKALQYGDVINLIQADERNRRDQWWTSYHRADAKQGRISASEHTSCFQKEVSGNKYKTHRRNIFIS